MATNGDPYSRTIREQCQKRARKPSSCDCRAKSGKQRRSLVAVYLQRRPKRFSLSSKRSVLPLYYLAYAKRYLQHAGDTLRMTYQPKNGLDILRSTSFKSYMFIADNLSEASHNRIRYCADRMPPPSAPNMRELRGNCQTWCIAVLEQLLPYGIGTAGRLASAKRSRDLLPYELTRVRPAGHPSVQPAVQPTVQQMTLDDPQARHQTRSTREKSGCCCTVM